MARNLNDILMMEFDLMYHMHMNITDFDNNDIKDNIWLHNRLCEQKREENKAREHMSENK